MIINTKKINKIMNFSCSDSCKEYLIMMIVYYQAGNTIDFTDRWFDSMDALYWKILTKEERDIIEKLAKIIWK